MSDKLSRSKFLALILFAIFSCEKKNRVISNTEIVCPDGFKVLIQYASEREVSNSIKKAYLNNKKYGTSDNYVAIILDDSSSLRIERFSPEQASECYLYERRVEAIHGDYIHKR